jgi:hypothetical protein
MTEKHSSKHKELMMMSEKEKPDDFYDQLTDAFLTDAVEAAEKEMQELEKKTK